MIDLEAPAVLPDQRRLDVLRMVTLDLPIISMVLTNQARALVVPWAHDLATAQEGDWFGVREPMSYLACRTSGMARGFRWWWLMHSIRYRVDRTIRHVLWPATSVEGVPDVREQRWRDPADMPLWANRIWMQCGEPTDATFSELTAEDWKAAGVNHDHRCFGFWPVLLEADAWDSLEWQGKAVAWWAMQEGRPPAYTDPLLLVIPIREVDVE